MLFANSACSINSEAFTGSALSIISEVYTNGVCSFICEVWTCSARLINSEEKINLL